MTTDSSQQKSTRPSSAQPDAIKPSHAATGHSTSPGQCRGSAPDASRRRTNI